MKRRLLLAAVAAAVLVPGAAAASSYRHRRRAAVAAARSAIEGAGFTNVQELKQEQGLWHATAQKDGRSWAVLYSSETGVSAQQLK